MKKKIKVEITTDYEVEKIIGKRYLNNQTQYKTKWKGYPMSQCTWEPIEHFKNCFGLIDDYEYELKRKKRKRGGRTTQKNTTIAHQINKQKMRMKRLLSQNKINQEKEAAHYHKPSNNISNDVEIISIMNITKKIDGVYAFVKYKCRDKEYIAEVNTGLFYTFYPEILIKYYESQLLFS